MTLTASHWLVRRAALAGLASIGALLCAAASGCCWLRGHTPAAHITDWQDPSPPRALLSVKAAQYQERLEARHLSPEGMVAYSLDRDKPRAGSYGNLADGPFHTGIYLSSQAHRYAVTREPAARAAMLRALNGVRSLLQVTGKRGLLARYLSLARDLAGAPAATGQPAEFLVTNDRWVLSPSMPGYAFRANASKDQYAGCIHGLGTVLALVNEPDVTAQVAAIAAPLADHLIENHLQIIDFDGSPTTHGNLGDRFGILPAGVNALIVLAIAKVAAVSTGEKRYEEFYTSLLRRDFAETAGWAHFTVFGVGNRVNDNMAHLALYPLFLLESERAVAATLWAGGRRSWSALREDRNAFFALTHAAMLARARHLGLDARGGDDGAGSRARDWLREFPEEKVAWPVDLTRPGFDFPRALLNNRKCEPRTTRGVPLYLRPRSSSFWASDPLRLVGNLTRHGDEEYAGGDYLLAYWMGRLHGFVGEED